MVLRSDEVTRCADDEIVIACAGCLAQVLAMNNCVLQSFSSGAIARCCQIVGIPDPAGHAMSGLGLFFATQV